MTRSRSTPASQYRRGGGREAPVAAMMAALVAGRPWAKAVRPIKAGERQDIMIVFLFTPKGIAPGFMCDKIRGSSRKAQARLPSVATVGVKFLIHKHFARGSYFFVVG